MTIYNTIGANYNTTRKADPYIAGRLYELLSPAPGGLYLDIGCGTGNYLGALASRGLSMYGADPSHVMLDVARSRNPSATIVEAAAESLPFPTNTFSGATAVLTVHHWPDMAAGIREIYRVLAPGARLVFFTFTPEQMQGYWLCHYFPQMMEACIVPMPGIKKMEDMLLQAGFDLPIAEKYFIRPDLEDRFMYANKYEPANYLSQEVRDNTSGFRLFGQPGEMTTGLAQLEQDITSGHISEVINRYENDLGDYLFLAATKPPIR